MSEQQIQILRCIDKADKIGRDGVVALLQQPAEDYGAGLDPVRANLIGLYLDTKGETDEATIENLSKFFARASRVRARLDMMANLEEIEASDGTTAWDRLLAMPANTDQTWNNGGRPENIAWALDDLVKAAIQGVPQ